MSVAAAIRELERLLDLDAGDLAEAAKRIVAAERSRDLSVAEAALELGVSRSALSADCAAKRVPHHRHGTEGSARPRYTFTAEHLAAIRAQREVRVAPVSQLPVSSRGRRSSLRSA